MYHFCTYFDRNYLLRGLTLYRSLAATGCDFTLNVLALDAEAENTLTLLDLPNLKTIPLAVLEAWEPGLEIAKGNRSLIEYYFTLSPLLPLYILKHEPQTEVITYLDADLYFYGSPEPIFTELGDRSILVIEHRYPDYLKTNERFGLFNVQYESFRHDTHGLACLERWRDQCLEWCYDRDEPTRYADQKYLNEWPERYGDHLVVLQHRGAGVAPWNWATYPLEIQHNKMHVGGAPLIFYHFHGVKIFHPCFISNGLADWGIMPRRPMRWLYAGYLRQLRTTRSWLSKDHGVDLPLKDRFIRGQGINMATMQEIARKAWAQGMVVV